VDVKDQLESGRDAYARRSWTEAYRSLSSADRAAPLGADDLELLGIAAHMVGREDEWAAVLERQHHAHLEDGDALPAVRCAFWLSLNLLLRGEAARANGWLGRGQRVLQREQRDCVERGYLLVPVAVRHEIAGELEDAYAVSGESAEIAERFGDADLLTLAMHAQGTLLIKLGRVTEGLALLDEAMVSVTGGDLSPMITGIVYCSVIEGCQEVYAVSRAQEWTSALTAWCEQQPDMVAFTGRCLVHRAEIMQLHGDWAAALEEARRAGARAEQGMNRVAVAESLYRQGELHRLRGEFDAAEEAYREASMRGVEPQPGLALLRRAQGRTDVAAAALERAIAETSAPLRRVRLLPAYVEIMLATGDLERARDACRELHEISSSYESPVLLAMVADAQGAVALAGGDARGALPPLRRAAQAWQEHSAPYEAARARVLLGLACRALGDDESADLELAAAREAFGELQAAPDLARLDGLAAPQAEPHGLTPRELQVLRLVAGGATNKAIAAELVLSERTVDRHVSNILAKLRVPSRAAATAFAYEHQLI
jgi:DNA-binding CsgD family transcriptional regulator